MAPRRFAGEQGGAFLLRSARGGNFLLQSRGIPAKLVQDAVSEVADDFNAYSRKRKTKSLLDPTTSLGQTQSRQQEDDSSAYNVSLGQRYVLQSKFLVTFRMVDTILVFYVAEPDSNPLISLRYVDAAAKILVGLSKGVDISHKRLAKKYADLYVLLGKLLSRGVRHLPSAFVHAPATNEKLLTIPVSTFEGKRKLKKVLDNKKTKNAFLRTTSKDAEEGGAQDDGQGGQIVQAVAPFIADEELMRRVWDKSGHDVRLVEFEVPAGALPPPPSRVVGAKRTPPAPPKLSEVLMERAWSGAMSASSGGEEDEEEEDEASVLDVMDKVAAVEAREEELLRETLPEGRDNARGSQSRRDLKQAVVMVEVWKGSVQSNVLTSVSVHGTIKRALAPYNVNHVLFRVHPSGSLDVDASLNVASLHKKYVRMLDDGRMKNASSTFSAALSGIPIDATYLKYSLPSAAVRPPLQASLVIGKTVAVSGHATRVKSHQQLLVCIPYAVDPALSSSCMSLVDVSITLSFPPDVDRLLKTSHKAEWCPIQCKLQWSFESLDAGAHGVVRAVVSLKAVGGTARDDVAENIDRVCSGISATILFSGHPGRSYSGVSYDIAEVEDGKDVVDRGALGEGQACTQFFSGNVRTFGELKIKV